MYNQSPDTARWYHMVNTLGAIENPLFLKGVATPSNYVERYLLNRAVPVSTQFYDAKPKAEAPHDWLKSPEHNGATESVVFPFKLV